MALTAPNLEAIFVGANDVARRLGVTVTPAGLQRLADTYDTVYPASRRDPQGSGRRLARQTTQGRSKPIAHSLHP